MSEPNPRRVGPRSLVELCLSKAFENIHLITGLGSMPPNHTKTLLRGVKTASQLRSWELKSDDIYDETAEHWARLIKRDFPVLLAKHNYTPSDPKSWHKVYNLYKKLNDDQIAASTQKMMQDFAAKDAEKTSRVTKFISGDKSATLQKHKAKPGPSAPRGKQTFMQKAKQEMRREAARFSLPTPTGKLAVPAGQINKVPQSMLRAAQIANQPPVIPRSMTQAPEKLAGSSCPGLQEKEACLRRIKTSIPSNVKVVKNIVSFSNDAAGPENDNLSSDPSLDEDALAFDDDDLFGDFPKKPTPAASTKPVAAPALSINHQALTKRPRSPDPEVTLTASTSSSVPPPPKRRAKGLSAAPGANNAVRVQKAAPSRPSSSSGTSSARRPSGGSNGVSGGTVVCRPPAKLRSN